jgi:plastocyanin
MLQLGNRQRHVLMGLLGTLSFACGGGGDNGGTPPTTTAITKVAADGQAGIVGQTLPDPLTVAVTDNGAPSAGATVTWATTSGGSLDPASTVTDADGHASSTWTLGTASGSQSATATLSGASGSPATFTASALTGEATVLSDAGGGGQTGVINTALAQSVQAKVADEFGNGVPGVAVAWTASGATTSAPTVPTDASGISSVSVTLGGTPGPVTVTATAAGLTGSPLTFNETATTAPPIPTTASVQVGNIFFKSARNSTTNAAVDTVAVGGTVTWSWVGGLHSVQSTGSPSFTSSNPPQSSGTYAVTFSTAGTYVYDCAVHGTAMTGRVVVR